MTLQGDDIEQTLDIINRWNKNLSFTHEVEDQTGCISFLDITIRHKEDNTIETSWYTKPTNNGVTLNFNAIAPMKFKRSVVSSFVYRIYNACSNWRNFHESIEKARHTLLDNSYPNEYITSVIHDTLERILMKNCENKGQKFMDKAEGKMLFSIQFRGPETLNFMRKLTSNHVPIIPVFTTKKLRYVMPSLKPKIEKRMRSQVFYKIKCPKSLDYYVGMTFRHLCTRVSEHFNRGGTMSRHIEECGLNFDPMTNTTILDSTKRNLKSLLILEALYIKELQPVINSRDEYRSRRLRLRFL